jgi:hypothetical protein
MEATNISIKQQSIVSINVETLQAIKQLCNVDTLGSRFNVLSLRVWRCNQGSMSLRRLYRQELRLARAVAAWCDRHNALVNWLMAILVMAFAFYVFLFV